MIKKILLAFCLAFCLTIFAQENPDYSQREVIYSRKNGMALTMFVTTPKKTNNHRAILYIASGGYYSEMWFVSEWTKRSAEYLKRGYTVFIVLHGSAPVYSGPDIVSDIQKAVQHVRYNAKEFDIDPDHIGITGNSSGANLSLMAANTDVKSNDPKADAEAKVSSRVQAVACFFPPTDFLNFGKEGNVIIHDDNALKMMRDTGIRSAFIFHEVNNATKTYETITDDAINLAKLKQFSPAWFVDKNSAPTLIYHGDQDNVVPLQQANWFLDKLKAQNIPTKLLIKKGGGHEWDNEIADIPAFADWFDIYLK